jgi:flagellar assembly protein FliH
MNSSTSRARGRVLRDGGWFGAADFGTVTSTAARDLVVDPALVEQATENGYRAGYDAGFTAGLEDASTAIQSREQSRGDQLRDVLARLANEVDLISTHHSAVIDEIEGRIVSVAFEIAQTVLGRELSATDQPAADSIRRALQFAPHNGPVIARLHPDDIASLGEPDALDAVVAGRALRLVSDPTLTPGDAIVDIGPARIDARIAPALERIREVLQVSERSEATGFGNRRGQS